MAGDERREAGDSRRGPNPDMESHEDTHCPTGAAEAKPEETNPIFSAPIRFVSFVLSWRALRGICVVCGICG
jgi:hypothetical protein